MVEINSDAEDQLLVEALQEYEDSKFGADTTRMDLKSPARFSRWNSLLMTTFVIWLSQSITTCIAVVEELSSEDSAEFEERATTRKDKRAKQLLESASEVPTSLFSAPTRTRRVIHVPQKLNL